MASNPTPGRSEPSSNCFIDGSRSYFQKTVCLNDWWLIKAKADSNGKRLAVAGFTSTDQPPVRLFSSAPICKRYNIFTLETVDGICIVVEGFINKLRTSENGFPDEVFKRFLFGFPPNWENYASNCFEGESSNGALPGNISSPDKLASHSTTEASISNHSPSGICSLSPENSPTTEERDDTTSVTFQSVGEVDTPDIKTDVGEVERRAEEETTTRKRTKKKISFNATASSTSEGAREKISTVSPECLSYRRSRSGRLLVPTLEFWRNQLPVYDSDRNLTGIQESLLTEESDRGNRSEPRKKRRVYTRFP